jgi:alanine racemase
MFPICPVDPPDATGPSRSPSDALDLDTVGRNAGTIGYEILTGLGSRYERHYLG